MLVRIEQNNGTGMVSAPHSRRKRCLGPKPSKVTDFDRSNETGKMKTPLPSNLVFKRAAMGEISRTTRSFCFSTLRRRIEHAGVPALAKAACASAPPIPSTARQNLAPTRLSSVPAPTDEAMRSAADSCCPLPGGSLTLVLDLRTDSARQCRCLRDGPSLQKKKTVKEVLHGINLNF